MLVEGLTEGAPAGDVLLSGLVGAELLVVGLLVVGLLGLGLLIGVAVD